MGRAGGPLLGKPYTSSQLRSSFRSDLLNIGVQSVGTNNTQLYGLYMFGGVQVMCSRNIWRHDLEPDRVVSPVTLDDSLQADLVCGSGIGQAPEGHGFDDCLFQRVRVASGGQVLVNREARSCVSLGIPDSEESLIH